MKTVNTPATHVVSTLPPIEPAVPSDPEFEEEFERLREERKERIARSGVVTTGAATHIRTADPDAPIVVTVRR